MPRVKIETWLDIPEDSIRTDGIGREEDILDEIKYAIQRVQRGYDVRVSWSIDYYLNEMMPNWLKELKESNMGVPMSMFEEEDLKNYSPSNEATESASVKWGLELDKMIAGFEAAKKIEDEWIPETESSLEWKAFNEGFESLKKHYFSLWD